MPPRYSFPELCCQYGILNVRLAIRVSGAADFACLERDSIASAEADVVWLGVKMIR